MKFIFCLALLLPCAANAATIAQASVLCAGVSTVYALADYRPAEILDPTMLSPNADSVCTTSGPARPGILVATGLGDGKFGGAAASFGDFAVRCGFDILGCLPDTSSGLWRPFTLGVPFQIHVEALAVIINPSISGSGLIDVQFKLFEIFQLPGSPELLLGALVPARQVDALTPNVPEPASWVLFASGAILMAWRRQRATH